MPPADFSLPSQGIINHNNGCIIGTTLFLSAEPKVEWESTLHQRWRNDNISPPQWQCQHSHSTVLSLYLGMIKCALDQHLKRPIMTYCKMIKQVVHTYILAAQRLLVNTLSGYKNQSLCSCYVADRLHWTVFGNTTHPRLSMFQLLIQADNFVAVSFVDLVI